MKPETMSPDAENFLASLCYNYQPIKEAPPTLADCIIDLQEWTREGFFQDKPELAEVITPAAVFKAYSAIYRESFPDVPAPDAFPFPVLFVNSSREPFAELIAAGLKTHETRTRNTLKSLIGRRVYIAETGRGKPRVICSAYIMEPEVITTRKRWEELRAESFRIPAGSQYDWAPDTRVKYAYPLLLVRRETPFIPAEGRRHGRVWMDPPAAGNV